jgi:hypothetical protein
MIPAVALAATVAGTLDVSDTSSIQFRVTPQGATTVGAPSGVVPGTGTVAGLTTGAVSPVGLDLATTPRALLRLNNHSWDYMLSYSPQVWALDVETGAASFEHPLLFQLANAAVTYHRGTLRLSLTESANYGEFNSALLFAPLPTQTAPTPPPTTGQGTGPPPQGQPPPATGSEPLPGQTPFQIVPAQTTIREGMSTTDLVASIPLSRPVSLRLGVGFLWGGGLDDQSRPVLPLQSGPHASAAVAYSPSLVDRFDTGATASHVESDGGVCVSAAATTTAVTECREKAEYAALTETWVHKFSRVLTVAVGAGMGVGYTRTESAPITATTTLLPTGQLSVIYRFGHLGANTLVIGLQGVPTVDPLTGRVIEPISAAMTLSDDLSRRVRLRFSLTAGQTVPFDDPAALTVVRGTLAVDFRVSRDVTASMGQWLLWQDQQGYGTIFSTSTYVALSVRAQSIRLR